MNNEITMMSVTDIQNLTAISEQVSPELLQPFIKNAEVMYLLPALGQPLYEDILANIGSGTTKYDALLQGWIYYVLAYYTWYNACPFLAYKFQKKGVVKQHSDDSENAAIDEVGMLTKRIESMASAYMNQLVSYLNSTAGNALYPLYTKDLENEFKPKGHSIYIKRRLNDGLTSYNPKNGYYI
jgi:hypothetical protein